MINRITKYTAFGLVLALAGCVPDGVTDYDWKALQPPMPEIEEPGYEIVDERVDGGVTARLVAWRGLHAGHNALRIRLESGGEAITQANLTLTAKVDGVLMPVVQPPQQANADGFFAAEAFLLPARREMHGHVDVQFTTADGASGLLGVGLFPLPDSANGVAWMETATFGGETVAVSWIEPMRPETGDNVLDVALHALTPSGPTPITDASLDLYPYMDMGGGDGHSTPYTAPVHVGDGRYRGSIQYVMSGGWDLTVFAERPDAPRTSVLFAGYTVFD